MKFFLLLILFFLIVGLQIAVLPRLEILGVVPNFILAATIVWAICEQERKSGWLVLIPAFLFDVVAGRPFGLMTLSAWLTFGFVRWLGRSLFKQSGFVSVLVLSVCGVLFYSLAFAGLAKLAEFLGLSTQKLFLADFYSYPNLLVTVLYNGLFCLLIFWPFKKLQRYFDKFSVQMQPPRYFIYSRVSCWVFCAARSRAAQNKSMDSPLNHNKKLKEYRVRKIVKETIEPEEILLDAAKAPELEDQKIEVPIRPKTFRLFLWLIVAGFLVLVGQSFYLQIIKGVTYQQLADRNSIRSFPIFASRGIIYDRTMKQLVYNIPSFDLVVTPQDLPKDLAQRNLVISRVADIVGLAEKEIVQQIEKFDFRVAQSFSLSSNLEHEKILVLESQIAGLSGFRIENNAVRQYVFFPYLSNVLGYLGKMAAEDLKNNPDYFMTEKIGQDGLEQSYEKILRGQPGEKLIEVDAQGRQKNLLSESEPKDGRGLVLTIDNELQKQLYEKLEETIGRLGLKKAAAVAIDPRSGGVLALVSLPSFNNNIFAVSLSVDDYANLKNDPNQPLFNRAVSGQYAPGSTVKPLIGAAALQEGVISKYTTIFDPGELVLANQYNPEIIYRFPDWKAHGTVDIYTAIAQSCDVFFYTIGGGYGNIEGLGLERLEEYFRLFGFGTKLGIDLPGEASGLVPSAVWKKEAKNEQWYTGDTYHISIGQGDLLVTPLQLVAATASLANGGKLLAPHLVDKIIDSDKNIINTIQSKILRANFVSSENLDVIKKGMRQAVTVGSAQLLNDLTISVAAKTGTAQVAGQKNPNAWVSLFAPYDNPQIALVVLLENAGEGSQVAVPIAKEILEKYFSK